MRKSYNGYNTSIERNQIKHKEHTMNFKSQSGQGLIEILLLIALIAIIGIVAGSLLGDVLNFESLRDGCGALANSCR